MSGENNKVILDDHQRFALMKFKRNLQDILQPHHTDQFLLRWLRARTWNVEGAEKMLRESLKWRQQWEVDTTLKSWELPEIVKLYYPYGTCGFDNSGVPVTIITFSGLDWYGLLHSVGRQVLFKSTVKIIENLLSIANENNNSNDLCVICDMEDFSLKQYMWRPAAEFVIALLQMYEANYPEILKACYIINAPRVFSIAFNIIKKFLNEHTISKIQIFPNNPKKWKAAILMQISPDQLPVHYGGNLKNPDDGNPKYTKKVNIGGRVPKSYYKKNLQQFNDDNNKLTNNLNYTTIVLKKGGLLNLDFEVKEADYLLRYDFRSEEHDIRFGITLKDSEGKIHPVIRHSRVSSHQIDVNGVLACQAPATYTVTFDNSYSLLRNKKIHYSIALVPSIQNVNIDPIEEIMEEMLEENSADNTEEIEDSSNL